MLSFKDYLEEVLTPAQRMKKKAAFRKSAAKRKIAIKRAKFKKASPEKLRQRARKLAIKMLKQKYAKKSIAALTNAEKMALEKRLEKKGAMIDRMGYQDVIVSRSNAFVKLRRRAPMELLVSLVPRL